MKNQRIAKHNRRRQQDEKGRRKKSMPVHGYQLKYTPQRELEPKKKRRSKKK